MIVYGARNGNKGWAFKFLRIIGLLYSIVHGLFFVVVCILTFYARENLTVNPGYVFIVSPVLGVFAGYFVWKGKYNWWRNILIVISLILLGVVLFISFVVAPITEKIHKQDALLESKSVRIDKDVERMFDGIYSSNIDIVREQLDKGVFVDARNETGLTALHVAQNKEIIKLLIARGADVNAVDEDNMTPLFNKDVSAEKILVEAGADINIRSRKGNTPLMWYCYSNYLEGVKYMVSLGADVNVVNADGHTAYDIAEYFAPEMLGYLKSIGAKSARSIN